MTEETRVAFHQDLEEIDRKVVQLFALVSESLAAATDAFLVGDREAAKRIVDHDHLIDSLYEDVENLVQQLFALQSPMAGDMRFLLSVLRVVPELERSGDLAEHVAQRAARGLAEALTPRVRGLIEQMGQVTRDMWRETADARVDRDGDAALALAEHDDELDDLHVSLTAELVAGQLTIPVAIEMALVGRFSERLGDHAVNVAHRVRFLVHGTR